MSSNTLNKNLGFAGALSLAITIVVGSGALILPGIAYQQLGPNSVLSWICAAIICIPLLIIFARLGADYPGAGGIAGFTQEAFGRAHAAGIEVILLGTFGLGIPSIALTGGSYIHNFRIFHQIHPAIAAIILLWIAGIVVLSGNKASTTIQVLLALILTIVVLGIGISGALAGNHSLQLENISQPKAWFPILNGIGLVFFAFTGWELISFTTGEYKNPRRDFPRVILLSFIIVSIMYIVLALGVESCLHQYDPIVNQAPLYGIMQNVFPILASGISLLSVIIIFANLIGAIWGASRLIFSSASEGLLPKSLATINKSHNPTFAVLTALTGFTIILIANYFHLMSLTTLLAIAGKNFFILYFICALSYTKIYSISLPKRILGGIVSLILAAIAVLSFGYPQLLYALCLYAIGYTISHSKKSSSTRS